MENFDSNEEEQFSKSIAEKLKKLRDYRDSMTEEEHKQQSEKLMQALDELAIKIKDVNEKAKYEGLTEQEKEQLNKAGEQLRDLMQKVADTQLLLGHSLWVRSVAYMNHVKQLADQGDACAKEIYDDLYPLYKKALEGDLKDKEKQN